MILSWLLTDEAFAVGYLRYRQPEHRFAHWYFLGSGLTLWICWQLSSLAGILLGASIPASLNLDFALPLTFLAILIPTLTDRPSLFTALAAVVLGTLLAGLPYQLGLPLAAMLAVGLGLRLDGHQGAQEGDPKA
jgi:predicted branched-subunit amino acid permease